MGNDKNGKEADALEEMTSLAESTRRPPLPLNHYLDHLKTDYDLSNLINAKHITKDDLHFIARVQSEIDKYSYITNIEFLSPEALFGAAAAIGAEDGVLGLHIRQRYENLTSIIHMCKKSK